MLPTVYEAALGYKGLKPSVVTEHDNLGSAMANNVKYDTEIRMHIRLAKILLKKEQSP